MMRTGNAPLGPTHMEIGPGILLKVMGGDKFNLQVNSWWEDKASPQPSGNPLGLGQLLAAISGSPVIQNGGHYTSGQVQNSAELNSSVSSFLSSQQGYDPNKPKAFVNWILLNEQFGYVSSNSGFEQVSGLMTYYPHSKTDMPISKNGYLYIYTSNETPNIDVFFDNLQVTHIRGPLVEENHYYPFGLTMGGISSKALNFGDPINHKKFNGIEETRDLDLNQYDALFRNLDPQIGRWWQIDPKPNESISLYAALDNNPIFKADPLGDTTWVYNQNGTFCGVVPDKLKNQVHYIKTDGDPGSTFDASKLSKKDAKTLGKAFRDASFAFIGSNSVKELKDILNDPMNKGMEALFVGKIGADKEIIFTQIDVPNSERGIDYVNDPQKWVDKAYPTDQSSLFMAGHTHTEESRNFKVGNKLFAQPRNNWEFLYQSGTPSNPKDYANMPNFNKPDATQVPLMIMTRYGFTLYRPGVIPKNSQYTFYDKF